MSHAEEKHSIVKEFDRLHSERGTLDANWSDVASVASPRDNVFNRETTQGENLRQNQYDETAELTLDRATSNYGAITTPDNQRWHGVNATLPELNEIHSVRLYFDQIENVLFSLRYQPGAGFSTNKYEENRSLLGFGNGILFSGEGSGFRDPVLWYKAIHLSQMYFSENNQGIVDKTYRHYPMTVRQVIEEFGTDELPDGFKDKPQEQETKVLHCVRPNPDFDPDPDNINPATFQYSSRYILMEGGKDETTGFLRMGGFRTRPYLIARDSRTPQEHYGRGTLQKVFPAISSLNQMNRTLIKVGHNLVDPINLMKDDSSVDMGDMRPGHGVVGGLDAAGNETIKPYNSGARYDINVDIVDRHRNTVKEAFLLDLFMQSFQGRERVTATEILERSREQGRLMTPLVSRSETESLGPMIEREIEILSRRGLFPEMPPELVEAQGEFEIEFTSPLSLAQKSDQAIGAQRTVLAVTEAAQVAPDVLDNINWDEYARIVHDAEGAEAKLLKSREEVIDIRNERQEQQELEMAAQAAPGVGSAVLDVAQAEQITTENE